MYAEYFRRRDWRTSTASDGASAIATAVRERPSIVVTELWLPHLDGWRLLSILKADASTAEIPVVVVTADAAREAVDSARSAGANLVLPKPCLPDLLFSACARAVAARHAESPENAARPRRPIAARVEATAPDPAPVLACPRCGDELKYERSYSGGVAHHREQWDYYTCPARCGRFCYRRRTRRMRRIG